MVPKYSKANRKQLSEVLNAMKSENRLLRYSFEDDFVIYLPEGSKKESECTIHEYMLKNTPKGLEEGAKVGEWTLLKRGSARDISWEVRCSCGLEKQVLETQLFLRESTRCHSCAMASARGRPKPTYLLIEPGTVIGDLTVERAHYTGKTIKDRRWWCRCSCGIVATVEEDAIRRERVQRCPTCAAKHTKTKKEASCAS